MSGERSFGEGLQTPPFGRPWVSSDAPTAGDWGTCDRRGRAGQENPARTSLRGTWFKPHMAMGTNRRL